MKRTSTIVLSAAVAATLAGCNGSSGSAATETVTETVTVTAGVDPAADAPSDSSTGSGLVTPTVTDFTLTPKVLSKQCYGSAGCSVTFRVTPVYSGATPPDSQRTEVTYEVVGSSSPYSNSFIMTGVSASVQQEEFVSTKSDAPITIKVTDVSVLE